MELVTIEVKLPKEVYDSASEILAKQGLTMEDALILFYLVCTPCTPMLDSLFEGNGQAWEDSL